MQQIKPFLLLFSLAALFSSTTAYNSKPIQLNRVLVTICLIPNTCNQRIPVSSVNEDCREDNLNTTTFTASNWSTSCGSATLGNGSYLAKLTYSDLDYSSIAAVLADVQAYYNSNGSLPADGQDIVTNLKRITVRRATSVR
jgi:hypothetical protein